MLLELGCPKAPEGNEPDMILRKLKGALTHPIGDYAVQPREASFAAHGISLLCFFVFHIFPSFFFYPNILKYIERALSAIYYT